MQKKFKTRLFVTLVKAMAMFVCYTPGPTSDYRRIHPFVSRLAGGQCPPLAWARLGFLEASYISKVG